MEECNQELGGESKSVYFIGSFIYQDSEKKGTVLCFLCLADMLETNWQSAKVMLSLTKLAILVFQNNLLDLIASESSPLGNSMYYGGTVNIQY